MADAPFREAGPVLVATDFSEDSEAAFAWAAHAAQAFAAPLHVLHVVHDPLDHPGTYARSSDESLEKLEDVARRMLDSWLERMLEQQQAIAEPQNVASSVTVGLPETRILEVAAQEGARLIVMGGRGQTGLAEILLGSHAERVARLSPIPLTIVRSPTPKGDWDAAGTGNPRGRGTT